MILTHEGILALIDLIFLMYPSCNGKGTNSCTTAISLRISSKTFLHIGIHYHLREKISSPTYQILQKKRVLLPHAIPWTVIPLPEEISCPHIVTSLLCFSKIPHAIAWDSISPKSDCKFVSIPYLARLSSQPNSNWW